MLLGICSFILIVLAMVMLFTQDYPDKVMGKIFMGIACLGGFIVASGLFFDDFAYHLDFEVEMIIFGLVFDKARSLTRFFKNRRRRRVDELSQDEIQCAPMEGLRAEFDHFRDDVTMFIDRQKK